MFGKGDGAWINWVGRWTAEEGRHAIVLRDYLTVTRNIDPVLLERGRMTQLQQGYDHEAPSTLRGLAYVAFQELATRIAHRNTGRYSDDPVADRIMVRIAADENLHMVFYRDILAAALTIQPSAAVRAIVDEVLAFEMPGAGIPGFVRKAAQIAKAGIYDLRVHRDEVLLPILRHWRIFELEGPRWCGRGSASPACRAPREARCRGDPVRAEGRGVGRAEDRVRRLTPRPADVGACAVPARTRCPRTAATGRAPRRSGPRARSRARWRRGPRGSPRRRTPGAPPSRPPGRGHGS